MMRLTPDQFKFLVANVTGLFLALAYRFVPRKIRHHYHYLPGVCMVYYCFGPQANSLVLYSVISYASIYLAPPRHVHLFTLATSLIFLSHAHLSRQFIHYGEYILDISGPFMIAFQKMTALGFCLRDGFKHNQLRQEKKQSAQTINSDDNNNNESGDGPDVLSAEQKKYAVHHAPSFNEFMGYFFHFPSVLCGPIMYFKDYTDFVYQKVQESPGGQGRAVAKKVAISATCAILHLTLNPKFDVEFLRSPQFLIETPILMRFYYVLIFTMLSRLKYYVAWHLGEAISNTTGIGFNGYDSDGKPKWNLISNMDLWKFETCLSMREAILAWNKTTQRWLRRTAYERAPRKLSVLSTYLLSAVWHGFYPGYYMTFLGGALFTVAARQGRRIVRPKFQRGSILPKIYDAITFLLTRLTIAYVAFPFVVLDFRNSFEIYKSLFFSIHILSIGGVLLGLMIRKQKE